MIIDRERVVEVGDSSDIPRVARHGACEEGGSVVSEVGDDDLNDVLWDPEPYDWG